MANFNASGLEAMTAIQVSTWLEGKGYPDEVCDAFIGKLFCQLGGCGLCVTLQHVSQLELGFQLANYRYLYTIDQEMDGEAVVAAFGTTPGPDCFRDVLPKVGQRMKVYRDIKLLMEVSLYVS